MKKLNIILGTVVLGGIVAAVTYSLDMFKTNDSSQYRQEELSVLQARKADEAQAWMRARYIDVNTGQPITAEKLAEVHKNFSKLPREKSVMWQEQGPDNIGGRTRAIQVNRNNISQIWAGGVSGGLFTSVNGGNSWTRVDSYIAAGASPFISSMTQTPDGVLYVATGFNFAYSEPFGDGNGVWYSTDQGETWNKIPGTSTCYEVDCSDNSNYVWLATNSGLRKWQLGDAALTTVTAGPGSCTALKVSKDGNVIVGAFGANKTYVSTNAGASFSDKSGTAANNLVPSNSPRIEYALSHERNASGNYSIYAVRTNSNLQGMNVSHDNGDTWTEFVGNPGTPAPSDFDIFRDQGIYNSIVSVAPQDPEMILIGGIDVWRWKQTVNNPPSGGFRKVSQWFVDPSSSIYVHADVHEMKWDNNGRFYVGTDGGVSISNNADVTNPDNIEWFVANRGYNVTQFYGIAFDKLGNVMGGTQDNGTLYNDHTMNTYQEFRQVNGGDGFECEISFYNERVMFSSVYYNSISRSGDRGQTWTSFVPDLPNTYDAAGTEGNFHPFHTEFILAENYDLNSKDSVTFIPKRDYSAGEIMRVPSLASGDTISVVASQNYYFDDQLVYDPSLTVNGVNYGINPATGETVEMGSDTIIYNVSWDTLRVQDPYQSWFLVYVNANGGELWGTRNALRLSVTDPNWVCVARNFGGGLFNNVDLEFSKDLEHLFISTGNGVTRVTGLGSVYTSDPLFDEKVAFIGVGAAATTPTYTTATKIVNGAFEGIAINPNDPDDMLLLPGFNGTIKRSSNATTATANGLSAVNLAGSAGVACYDGIIDREDSDILVIGTSNGVIVSQDGGATWINSSAGFEGTPVFEVRQSWRAFDEGNTRPGEIYIGTFGRGIWSTAEFLGVDESQTDLNKKDVFKFNLVPNPTNSTTAISVDFDNTTNAEIEVYNINGAKVKMISLRNLTSGHHDINIDAEDLKTGTYIVRLIANGKVASSKFVKM